MPNRVVWFDIPVRDLGRAMEFYSEVLDVEVSEDFPGVAVIVARNSDEVFGCLFESKTERPTWRGPLVYFDVSGRMDAAVEAAERCGGRVLDPSHRLGPFGQRAVVIDSEGNRIALHSE